MFKKKAICFSLILLIFLTPVFAQEEDEVDAGFGLGDIAGLVLSTVALAGILLLRTLNIIPDSLYEPLLIAGLLGIFIALQLFFDSIGFQLDIGGFVLEPIAIGILMILLVYHNFFLNLLSYIKR